MTRSRSFFHLTQTTALYFVVTTAFWLFIQSLLFGRLQGEERFGRIGLMLMGEGVFRGALGVLALVVGAPIPVVVAVYTLSAALTALLLPRTLSLVRGGSISRSHLKPVYLDIGQLVFTNFCLSLLVSLDVLLSRRYLSLEAAGQYAALSSMAKLFLFATGSISTVAFAALVRTTNSGQGSAVIEVPSQPLLVSFGLVTVLGACFTIGAALFGQWAMTLLYGNKFTTIGHVLWIPALGACAIGIINLLVAFFNARRWFWYLLLLAAGAVVIFYAFASVGDSIVAYASVFAAVTVGLAIALLLLVPLARHGSETTRDSSPSVEVSPLSAIEAHDG